ncbi:MAG: 1A family penicillin-binding protein, partial [Parcubacteria group bacterium LiPW_39]
MRKSVFYHQRKKPRPVRGATSNGARRRGWRFLLKFLLAMAGLAIFSALAVFTYFAKDLPDPEKISQRQIVESSKIYDRTGQVLLYDIHGEEKRTVVGFEQISPYLKQATVVTEDANFYNHFGLDFKGILRAMVYNILGRKISQGGSTITQQFVKKSILSDERTWSRKIKEAVLALELERKYSKDEILSFYLNQIPYGSNAYGIEAAAQTFFDKPAENLDLAESAILAALPNAPSRLSPFGSRPEELKARQEYILDRMVQFNYISQEEAASAKEEKLNFASQAHDLKAPHFVMYVKEYLEEKYGQDMLEKGGLKVYTTLDWDLQRIAQQMVEETAKSNEKKYGAYNAALTALDPKTGQILVMVGSRNYFATGSLPLGCSPGKTCRFEPNVNVTIRERQPGSSFKPFAYVTAFKKGYTPDTILFDLKTEFNPHCPPSANQEKDQSGLDCYHPGNYDDRFRGPVTARQALAQSLNVPSVQVLYLAGVPETIKTAKEMGITTLNEPQRYGLSLVLGGGEVKLLDEVAAYGVFAAEGIKYEKTPILKIEDAAGKIIEEFKSEPKKVLEPQLARLISDILSDNASRSPIFGSSSALYFPERPVAAKTGTTQGYRDAWAVGYTPSLAAGVWVGNNDNSSMAKAGAGMAAAGPLWHAFIKKAYELKSSIHCKTQLSGAELNSPLSESAADNRLANKFCLPQEPEQFIKPEPINTNKAMLNGSFITVKTIKLDKISGQLATEQTPPELVQERELKEVHSILYYVQKDSPQAEPPAKPSEDPQFSNWEAAVASWLTKQNDGSWNQQAPNQSDSLHTPANLPQVKIISPADNQIITQPNLFLRVEASAPLGLK